MPAATTPTASIGFEAWLWEAADLYGEQLGESQMQVLLNGRMTP